MLLSRKRLLTWAVLPAWVVITILAVPAASRLSDVVEAESSAELPRGAQSTEVAELTPRFPGGETAPGVIAYVRPSGITPADRAEAEADRRALAPIATAAIAPPQPSRDGRALMLTVPLADDDTLTDKAGTLRDTSRAGAPPGLEVRLTGPAGAALDVGDAFERIDRPVLIITVLVVTAVLLLTYRSPVLWLLPIVNAAIALQVAGAVVYLLGEHAGLYVADGMSTILNALVFGLSTDYALLLLARYREELRRHPGRHRAMAAALRRAAAPIAASAATVSLGLLCLLAADMGFNHALGPVAAIGVLCGLAVVMSLLPALLVVLGRWVFWPRIPRYGDAPPARGAWDRVGHRIAARPRLVWIGGLAVLGALSAAALGMDTGLDRAHFLTTTPSSTVGERLLAEHYPGGQGRPVQVIADRPDAASVTAALRNSPGVADVGAPLASTDGRLARLDAVLADPPDSEAAERTVRALREHIPDARFGAGTAAEIDLADAQSHDRRVVIPLVLGVVLLVLVALLRALVAPLLVVATVVASYSAALGAAWLLFRHAFGFPAVDTQVALMGFLFMVALGVDYNLFLVSRVREEVGRTDHRTGVLRGLAVTGGVISSAGLVLAATFGTLGIMPVTMMVQIGVLVSLGVLLDTFFVRSVIVPALALDTGPRFWWPARERPK
ncbi:MMPL family transporter [Actinomadura livida]|uniref:MMPL family transporter n=1 Tax=Actinomadura livida TaxID=79909 RepID=A0A7W7N0H8_9ACTN|nr:MULTISPECIES: MMPL family transporter [Actinomadura]MBB4776945.1 RND superfamily putative drug exporter [Actinomadura catellatispora]GGT95922.1 putative membrane protein ActII-3 [Actinomadura livida]